jgi:hypothetical protein
MGFVSPNLAPLTFPDSSSILLAWSINGDTPQFLNIVDECSGLTLVSLPGDYGGQYELTGLAARQYVIFLAAIYPGNITYNSNSRQRYPNQACAPASTQPAPWPAITYNGYPKDLQNTNRIVVTCTDSTLYDHWMLMVDNVQTPDQTGSTYEFASQPRQTYAIKSDGLYTATDSYANFVGPVTIARAVDNLHSVRDFLSKTGQNGSSGLRRFLAASNSTGIRNMLGL